jgi:hypothetical protein
MTVVNTILLITSCVPLFIAIGLGAALASFLRTPLDEAVYRSLTGRCAGADQWPVRMRPGV